MNIIIWKRIKGFETRYLISSAGNVRSLYRNKNLSIKINPDGYEFIHLSRGGRQTLRYIHRLVAEHFIENKYSLPEVNHVNGNKSCNESWNLQWCTRFQNIQHSWAIGLRLRCSLKGERNPSSKLRAIDVIDIRRLLNAGESGVSLARKYDVTPTQITHIKKRKAWKEI